MKPIASLLFTSAFTLASGKLLAEPYLFEELTKPSYYKSWSTLFVGEKNIDFWLAQYAKTKNGPASPGRPIKIGESSYQINMVCKTHDCEDNQFFVLFAPKGTKAWGLLLKDRAEERFFGNPDEERMKALRSAAYE